MLTEDELVAGRTQRRTERGQGLLELGLLLPVLLLLLLGILDVGRLYMTLVAINDAAAEGASYAAQYPARTMRIQQRAAESSTAMTTIDPSLVLVTYVDPPSSGDPITVTVQYDYEMLTPLISAIVPGGTLRLRGIATRTIY
ncbi:MAG: pilus assembly protein [Anaerolineae bacterium]|nr:pilus assembly protein [Anaerolineae bacterium]